MSTRRSQAINNYLALPADQVVPIDQLEKVFKILQPGGTRYHDFVAAHCLSEIAGQLPVDSLEQRRALMGASSRIIRHTSDALRPVIELQPAARLVTALPLVHQGPSNAALQRTRNIATQHLRSLAPVLTGKSPPRFENAIRGMIGEQLTVLAANAINNSDVYGIPSFERQDNATALVDGHIYRWDLAVKSSGRIVTAGTYHLQVSASGQPRPNEHPAIIPVSPLVLYQVPPEDTLADVARGLPESGIKQQPDFVLRARQRLLSLLQQRGPSTK